MTEAKRGGVLAILERKLGAADQLNPASLETIAAAQQLAARLGAGVSAVLLEGEASALAAEVAQYRLEGVLAARDPRLAHYNPDTWMEALQQIVTETAPAYVLFPHTYQVRDYAPRLATRMGGALIGDVIAFGGDGAAIGFVRPMFQGKWNAEVAFTTPGPGFVTLQIGAWRADQAARGAAAAPIAAATVTPGESRLRAGAPFQEAKQAVDLSQAELIVAVGRGIKEPKNLDLARALAQALGAELAASRPICDSGWLPMDRQIGSSGQTVAPKLYLAVGISGAIQHLVGMKGARAVAAINKDPEAPIFEVADYAIVGNLFDVVPALIEELNKAKA